MAKRSRLVVLMKRNEDGVPGGPLPPLGTRAEIRAALEAFNTYPDGAAKPAAMGTERLYGPGFVIELATSVDKPSQVMVTIDDDETAWPELSRICRRLAWSMADAESGRVFI